VSNTEQFCLYVFCKAGLPRRIDCLVPRTQQRATALGIDPRFCNVSSFDHQPGALPTQLSYDAAATITQG